MTDEWPAELTDDDVQKLLARKLPTRVMMLVTEGAMYERGADGVWYRLGDEPHELPAAD